MRPMLVFTIGASLLAAGGARAQAPAFKIGDRVTCSGSQGPIVRLEPRPGWDEPFYIVKVPDGGTSGEFRCLSAAMRLAPPAPPAGPPAARAAAQPARPAAAPAQTAARAPRDGSYRCHKISPGGQLMDIGVLDIRGGRATLRGMPAGWTVRSVHIRGTNDRGQPIIAFDYRSAAGFNDSLDCLRQ